ncbi:MAG: transcriptional regulator MntR, partial [Silicimonas sp.]|nr:transcriptional regulator MntR [Silicimonas sp.]
MSSGASQTREDFTPDSRDPEAQADGFANVRNAHESEMAEDYVELIAELI